MDDSAALDDLRDEITAIYVGEPDQFIAARTALVKRLRGEGRREDATAVGKLRKPTLAAWALDVVCVADPDALDKLVDAGTKLRDAQEAALRGGASRELRDALDARRAAARTIVNAAVQHIVDHGGDGEGARDEINATLEAASLDEDVAAALRVGRLERTVAAPSGFDLFAGMPFEPAPKGARRTSADEDADEAPEPKPDRAAERRAHREHVRAALAAADEADALVAERRREVERLERELEEARQALEDAARDADEAQRVVDELTGDSDD